MHAQARHELGQDVEVVVLGPDAEAVGQGCRGDDRVRRTRPAAGRPRGGEQLAESRGDRLVVGQRDEAPGSRKRCLTQGSQLPSWGATDADDQPASGKVAVKLKLSRKNLKALKHAKQRRFTVTASLAAKTFTTKVTLKAPKKA